MKIFRVLCFGLFLIIGLSCSQKQKTYKIAYLNASAERTRFVREGNYLAERLRELGHEVIIVAAEDNDALQLAQGYELIDEDVDVLVIVSVNGNTIAPLVRDARKKGVKVIAYNRLINNVDFDFFVTGDNKQYAKFFCETALQARPGGNYVILGGDRFDRNGLEMKQYVDSILLPHVASGNVNILYETFIEGWSGERAKFEMQQVVDSYGLDIDAVIACNDPMAMGALEVFQAYDAHENVIITGQGAYLDVVQSIYKGEITMTIYHPLQEIASKTADMIVDILNGKNPAQLATSTVFNGHSEIATVNFPSVKITKENLEKELIESGEYLWSDLTEAL